MDEFFVSEFHPVIIPRCRNSNCSLPRKEQEPEEEWHLEGSWHWMRRLWTDFSSESGDYTFFGCTHTHSGTRACAYVICSRWGLKSARACACADWVTWTTNLRCRSLLLTSLDSRLFIPGNVLAYFHCYILSSNCLKCSHGQNLKESNTNNFLKINTISSTMPNICGRTCIIQVSEDVHVKTRVRSMSDVSGRCRMLSTTAAAACTDRGSSSRVTKGQRISIRCDVYLPKSCFWFTTYICEAYLPYGLFNLLKKKEKKGGKLM